MASLTDEHKTFIVEALACFDTPTVVARSFEERFGIKIDRFQVFAYSPKAAKPPAKRWLILHEEIRKAFLEEASGIAVAHRSVRLRKLERMVESAEARNNIPLASQLLEQVAKEVGDSYSNKVKHKHEGTGPNGAIEHKIGIELVEPNH